MVEFTDDRLNWEALDRLVLSRYPIQFLVQVREATGITLQEAGGVGSTEPMIGSIPPERGSGRVLAVIVGVAVVTVLVWLKLYEWRIGVLDPLSGAGLLIVAGVVGAGLFVEWLRDWRMLRALRRHLIRTRLHRIDPGGPQAKWWRTSSSPIGMGADAAGRGAAGGVGGAFRMRPLTRWDVIFVVIVAAGAGTRFLTLAPKPSGWLLVLDVIVSASLGLLAAVVIASLVRRAWLDRLGFTLGVVVVVLGGLTVLVLVDFVAGLIMGLVRPGGG